MLANRANIGYTTGGHTGEDVFLYSFGPSKLTGLVENTDLAHTMARFMGFDLNTLTNDLYVPATKAFTEKGFTTKSTYPIKKTQHLLHKSRYHSENSSQ